MPQAFVEMGSTTTKWNRERIQTQAEIAQLEREQAIEDILLRMQRHEMSFDELKRRGGLTEATRAEPKPASRGSFDPVFG